MKTFEFIDIKQFEVMAAIKNLLGDSCPAVSKPLTIYPPMRCIRVYYSNGDIRPTDMAAGLSDAEMLDYFRPGAWFNLGIGPHDNMVKVIKSEIIR